MSLRASLQEAEQALNAIRAGDVDVLVMGGARGPRVFTQEGADHGYRVLLEVMSEGVAKVSQHGVVAYCNARFADILGVPLEQTIGSSIHDLVHPDERERFVALMAAGVHARSEGEFALAVPGGRAPVPVLLSVVPLTMADDPMLCLVMCDVTERRRQGDAIAAERAALHARLLVADRMLSMGVVAAGVAHEINNPLACVVASLELILNRLPDLASGTGLPPIDQAAWMRRQLERAQDGAARVRTIVRELRAFSRADDETVATVDLRRVLDTSIALVSNEIRHHAKLVRDYDDLPNVRGNAARLGQVFVNLLMNAAQAIPAGAANRNEIRVSGHADRAGHAVIEIRDTGTGIAPENLDRIFEPFFTTKAVGLGTGLGLALCHGIVTSLHGRIAVESAPGAGSVFRVVIPAMQANDVVAQAVVAGVAQKASRERLLIIDDEEDLCEVLQEALAPFYDVVTTTDALRALEWIAWGERFDLILCDIRMPKMTGIDFYAKLASDIPEQAERVVLMSGGFTRLPGEAPLALPSPILEKPFEIEQVHAIMAETARRGGRPGGAALPAPTLPDVGGDSRDARRVVVMKPAGS